jgi:uncharacterized RDD family membrane protein YckC
MARAEAKPQPLPQRSGADTKRQRPLVTPEGVDLQLQIADAGERAGAFVIDALIIVGSLIALTILSGLALTSAGLEGAEYVAVIWLLGFFFLRNFYFVAFELGPRAATPGKRVVGIRVASRDGGRLTANAIFARNAMREIEVFLPISFLFAQSGDIDGVIALAGIVWSGIFVLFPLFNRDRLRAGDMLGGTWVVKTPKRKLDSDLAAAPQAAVTAEQSFAFTREQLDAYGVHELHVLEDVLRTNDPKTVSAVAERIRAKIGWPAAEPDLVFLSAYYPALRQRLEARLLLGVRRKDKHDIR